MGPGEAMSVLGLCVVLIVALAVAFAVFSKRLAFKQRKLELDAQVAMGGPGSAETVARLEKRVRVLERLATERGPDVAAQIEALRENRELADLTAASSK